MGNNLRDEYHDLITDSPLDAAEAIGQDFPFLEDPAILDVWADVLDEGEMRSPRVPPHALYQAFGRGQGRAPLPAGTTALAFIAATGHEHNDFIRNVEALHLEHVPFGDGPPALGVLVFELDKSGQALPVLRRWEPPPEWPQQRDARAVKPLSQRIREVAIRLRSLNNGRTMTAVTCGEIGHVATQLDGLAKEAKGRW